MTAQDPGVDDRADEIFVACRRRLDAGESVDVEAVLAENADLAQALRERFDALDRLGRALARGGPAPASLAGRTIGPYRLDSVLGAGGMGTVYLATVEGRAPGIERGTRVAVKVIHPHLFAREGFFKRFLREAEIGRRVRHENVVRTLDADAVVDDGTHVHFVVMEYVEGQTLRSLANELTRVPEELCRHVGRAIARALNEIHAAGAIHRDVKPENVMITKDHVVRLMDLGVARLAGDEARLSQTGAFVGSVLYAAPEQFRTRDVEIDGRADLYALGLLLYELATGRHPFADDDVRVAMQRQLTERARPAGEVNPQLSPLFESLLGLLLAKDRDERPADAAAVARILDEGEESAWWRERSHAIRVATERPLRRIRVPRETALYGRDAEIERLRSLYEKAKSGEGQVVLVEGEAGIGKSRLVDEFVGRLHWSGEDVNYLFGSYPPGGAATASGAFSTAYREHLGDDESAIRAALPVTPLLVPAFAALLRGDVTPAGAEPLTKDSLQTVFVHATRSFAAQRTTIVLIDDLHFAPEEGRALFASLALAVPGHCILLVGTARPGIDANWTGQIDRLEHSTHLHVPRLGPKDLVLLLKDSVKSAHLAEELAAQVAVKSDGNPFFVFEILRGLREGQFLTRKPDGTWITTQSIRELQVPSTITDIVQARISGLGLDDRNLLEAAACIGFEFDPSLLGPVLGVAPIRVLQRLGQIEKAHRLVRSAGRRLVFDHHQVQEVLYTGMLEPLREAYHASIGAAIESRSGAAAKDPQHLDGALCVELAEHFLRGAQGERALRYLDSALTHLENGYRHGPAILLAGRAAGAEGLVTGVQRVELLLRRAQRFHITGRREEQARDLVEATDLADRLGDPACRARVRVRRGSLLAATADLDAAERALVEGIDLALVAADRRLQGEALADLGGVYKDLGRLEEARGCHEQHLALSREIGNRRGELVAISHLATVLHLQGRYEEACEHDQRSLAVAHEIGDRERVAGLTVNLAVDLRNLGRVEESRELVGRGLAYARELGHRTLEAVATGVVGLTALTQGRIGEAREACLRAIELNREVGRRTGEANALLVLSDVYGHGGDIVGAREAAERSLVLSRDLRARNEETRALRTLAVIADAEGDETASAATYLKAIALSREIGATEYVASSLLELGDLERRSGDYAGARAHVEESLALFRARHRTAKVCQALATLACLPGGDADAAVEAIRGASKSDDGMDARLLLWRATGDLTHLAAARRFLDALLALNPPETHAAICEQVRLHREILTACREQGIA